MLEASSNIVHDVVIVGAGAAGIGVSIALKDAGISNILVLEKHRVGASFDRWPVETQFITPSFPTNSFGMLDLNSIALGVSPAYSMEVEHPTGQHYAQHLRSIALHFEIPIQEQVDVNKISKLEDGFRIESNEDVWFAKHVIWAAGEFLYPNLNGIPGSELCRHTATIASYENLEGDDFIVIGGYESGVDAAFHLAYHDKRVRLFDRDGPWESGHPDPSVSLSPFTLERMKEDWFVEQVELIPYSAITSVTHSDQGYAVESEHGDVYFVDTPPLFAGGFDGSHGLVRDLFELRPDGFPLLNEQDESTLTPGLYLSGASVRHDNHIFCFIYKYRQRFAVVAKSIADSMGLPADGLEVYRSWGMYLDDLSCCGEECVC